jgi:Cu(I)/Ag(I) efflux system membrane protein CusA/SilA
MTPAETFLGKVIDRCARQPFLTLLLVGGLTVWGVYAYRKAPLDALPDLSDVQVIVFTEWPGQSPDLVESQVTYPLSSALLSAPKVQSVRGQSMFGMSFVYVIFEDDTDIYWARSRILEYLSAVSAKLPEGVTPTLGPDASGVGWVFQYVLTDTSGKHDLQKLRALQDWNLRYALQSVPGVAEVAPLGGYVKQYQVQLDPQKLFTFDVSVAEVVEAVRASNEEVGGRVLEMAGHEYMIRGRGYVKSLADLETIPLKVSAGGTPVFVRDVAVVTLGPEPRRGLAEWNGEGETVGGIVVMRYGENALTVISAVKARLKEVAASLPEGVSVRIAYDRSELIEASIATLHQTLLHELLVVSLIIFAFMLHARSALVPVITIPVAVLLSFIPMLYQGLGANILSLGGIAVAIGALVDGAIIVVDNVHKRLEEWEARGRPGERLSVIISAMQEVGPTLFFSLLVITVSFMPVFTLEGTEGRLFRPLAFTKTYSMGFAAVLAVTLAPALAALLIRGKIRREEDHPVTRWLTQAYSPVVVWAVARARWILVGVGVFLALSVPATLALKAEFMPPLNEGAILYMPTAPPGMSMTEAARVLSLMDQALKRFPEVESVFGKMGRANTATDPAPLGMAETTVVLKPRHEWRKGMTYELLLKEMDEALQFPGMPNIWWMPIQTRTEMLSTGVRSPLGIQVFGDTLEQIEKTAVELERLLLSVPGTRSAFAERSTGGFYLDVEIKRREAARYGLLARDINEAVSTAIGGMTVSQTVEGRERYPIQVGYAREFRDTPEALGRVLVATREGAQIPLSQVADIRSVLGPPMVRSEDGRLVGFVFVDTDVPLGTYVDAAREVVAKDLKLPPGVRLSWVGQFKHLERARARLLWIAPLTLFLVILLLYFNTGTWAQTLLVVALFPVSIAGGLWAVYLLDYHLSVAVWVGVIAMVGLDAETSVVMLMYLNMVHRKWLEEGRLSTRAHLTSVIVEGSAKRLRPKLMTVATTLIGLLPLLWSDGTGADLMKRIAAPMVGGLVVSTVVELLVFPALFAVWKGAGLDRLTLDGGRSR